MAITSPDIQKAAADIEHAQAGNYQIQPLSRSIPGLNQTHGYEIAAAIKDIRTREKQSIVVGRKIGFTNRNIWPEYNIDASNWSYMYDTTVVDLEHEGTANEDGPIDIDIRQFSNIEPRIEPEIVLGISGNISSSMSDEKILQNISWISHGFEIVASIFPNWKFTAADTTAAFALHGKLLIGPRTPISQLMSEHGEDLLHKLSSFNISLFQNDKLVDEGKGSNVLGSPIKALRHLLELLESDRLNAPLLAGEIVTTGTLTRALPIEDGDVWSTQLSGIGLPGLRVKFRTR